jgi:hypothetical protein
MGVVLEEALVEGPIEGLRGIPPEVYPRTTENMRVTSARRVFRTAVSLAITPKQSVVTPECMHLKWVHGALHGQRSLDIELLLGRESAFDMTATFNIAHQPTSDPELI